MNKLYNYYVPKGGLPQQNQKVKDRAIFKNAYLFIPREVLCDIVTSQLPFWNKTRMWVLSRPMSGFSETFSHYIVEVKSGGGSDHTENDPAAESILFVVEGTLELNISNKSYKLSKGSYVFLPPSIKWTIFNHDTENACFHWIRKKYSFVEGINEPNEFVKNENDVQSVNMPESNCMWSTKRFVDTEDMRHDMHVNIVSFKPGGIIPFLETHVMEHGLYVLQGEGIYNLNQDKIHVKPGDYMLLRAFCPQSCEAIGKVPFRYLLYKDVNRHMTLK